MGTLQLPPLNINTIVLQLLCTKSFRKNFAVNLMNSYGAMAASVQNTKYSASMPAEEQVPCIWVKERLS